jgi:hypothetical protein
MRQRSINKTTQNGGAQSTRQHTNTVITQNNATERNTSPHRYKDREWHITANEYSVEKTKESYS